MIYRWAIATKVKLKTTNATKKKLKKNPQGEGDGEDEEVQRGRLLGHERRNFKMICFWLNGVFLLCTDALYTSSPY